MIVLLGSSGMVGSEFKRQLRGLVVCVDRIGLGGFDFSRASVVINCVGKCSGNTRELYDSNVAFPVWLANRVSCKLIHIGTTVVGDYWYGLTKAFADEAIQRLSNNYTIYRFPWLEGNDFCKYVKGCVDRGVSAEIFYESGYPSNREACVKYVIDNMYNYNNEIISLGGKQKTKAEWAKELYPDVKINMVTRSHSYRCIEPQVVI